MKIDGFIKAAHQIDKIRYRPSLLWKISKGYFKSLALRQNVLRVVEFSITGECQSKCEYCYASNYYRKGENLLSLNEIKDVWQQASRLGAFSSFVMGGEPTIHPQFLDIIEVLEPKKNIVSFATNAIDVDEKMILELKKLGVFLIYLSVSSTDPDINDKARGYSGHYNKVIQTIDLCKKHKMDVVLAITTDRSLLGELVKFMDFIAKYDLQANINLITPSGRATDLKEKTLDEGFWKTFRDLYISNSRLRGDWDVNLTLRVGCPAGYEKIHIAPYGDVTGCSLNPVSFGNVREMRLKDILAKMKTFTHFNKRSKKCIVAIDQEYIKDYIYFSDDQPLTPYKIELNPKSSTDLL